jgi:hypothetical protein
MKDFDLDINMVFKGIITGFLIAYLLILGLRPAAAYPDDLLEIIDNPWIFLILFIVNLYVLQWNTTIGLLFSLSLIALILDIIIFTEGEFFTEASIVIAKNTEKDINKDSVVDIEKPTIVKPEKGYKDINDIIINKLKFLKDLNDKSDSIKTISSFI